MIMSSEGIGFAAVVALSGSIFYVVLKAHQQLVSDFKNQIRRELGRKERSRMKRVAFADEVLEPSSNNRAYRKSRPEMSCRRRLPAISEEEYGDGVPADMPLNRVALYKGIKEDRLRRGPLHLTRPRLYRDSAS
ncbi:uncharacterized protein LOC116251187 [Nymphaea colorata]|nr:uncharacterized protein LOC116251187 [Nymphaea colorata]